jgi:hypothetical protein
MQGAIWPNDGDIDVVEQVNLRYTVTLHALNGRMHPSTSLSSTIEAGTVISADCFNQTNGNQGCIIQDLPANLFGAGFASNGGGVFAMLWDDMGIKFWFFNPLSIPTNLPTASPNLSGWTTPTAFFPITSCNTTELFSLQTLIFVSLRFFAPRANIYAIYIRTPPLVATSLLAPPTSSTTASNYNNAYFEIAYIWIVLDCLLMVSYSGSDASASSSASSPLSASTTSASSSGSP